MCIAGSYKIKNIDLNLLLVFLKVYETGNLSKSSNALGLSQPGVSLALNRLRDHFEDRLFVRTPKGMEPTVFGHALFPSIKTSADCLQESLRFQLNFVPDESDRVFRLSMSEFGQLLLLPHLLERTVSNLKCNTREFNERLRSGGDLPKPGPRFVVGSSSPAFCVAWC